MSVGVPEGRTCQVRPRLLVCSSTPWRPATSATESLKAATSSIEEPVGCGSCHCQNGGSPADSTAWALADPGGRVNNHDNARKNQPVAKRGNRK